jgi:ABC-type multidrug transport system fused ATPase/permease subunit
VHYQLTSSGRIISRFSSDCDTLDLNIPTTLASFADAFLAMVTALVVVAVATPAFFVFVPPIVYAYYRIQQVKHIKCSSAASKASVCKLHL